MDAAGVAVPAQGRRGGGRCSDSAVLSRAREADSQVEGVGRCGRLAQVRVGGAARPPLDATQLGLEPGHSPFGPPQGREML